jgi:OmpA-OmpF porin, OOP family
MALSVLRLRIIEVTPYASSAGTTAVNQELSEDHANAVTNILPQNGHVPLTLVLAPGAMGEAHQIGTHKSAEG